MKYLLNAAAHGTQNLRLSTNLLSAYAVGGIFSLVFLFALCFVCIHILKCAKIGFFHHKKPTEPPPPPKEDAKKAPTSQEPIYYIVERKRMRAKPKYGEPKQILFK